MKNFIADLKFLINPGSSIVRSFKEEFSWIKKTALKQHFYTYHGSLTTSPYSELCNLDYFYQTYRHITKSGN